MRNEKRIFLNIIVTVIGEYQWRGKRDQSSSRASGGEGLTLPRRWRTKSIRGLCPCSSFTASFPKPSTGFVHLALWSRLQTLSPNSNCHSCLCPLHHAHVFNPPFAALSCAAASGNQPVTVRGAMLICGGSLYTEPLAETFVTVTSSSSNWWVLL